MKQPGSFGGDRIARENLRLQAVPMEWMAGGAWKLPSGKALAEFALQAGFLAPLLLEGRPGFGSDFLSGLRGRKARGSQERAAH